MNNPEIEYYTNGNILYKRYANDKGQRHRTDGPAFIRYREDGSKWYEFYYQNDIIYRENNLPTDIYYYENGSIYLEKWLNERDQRHNESGPAKIKYPQQ